MDIEAIAAPILFTLLSFFTRLYRIGRSNIVTWDEAQYVVPFLLHGKALGCITRDYGTKEVQEEGSGEGSCGI